MSDVIEYENRADMVAGLLEFRKDKNVASIDVIDDGRSLRITHVDPDYVDETLPPIVDTEPVPAADPAPDPEVEDTEEQQEGGDPAPDPEVEDDNELNPEFIEKIAGMTVSEIEGGLVAGSLDQESVLAAEQAGRKRKGVLDLVEKEG